MEIHNYSDVDSGQADLLHLCLQSVGVTLLHVFHVIQ